MAMPKGFYEGAAAANAEQLRHISVTVEKLTYITSVRLNCDYDFRLGGLEYKAESLRLKTEKLKAMIELKCSEQGITRQEAEERINRDYAKRDEEIRKRGMRVIGAVKMLETPMPKEHEINQACEIMENLMRKMDPLFAKVPKSLSKKYEECREAFRRVDIPKLALLDAATDEPEPAYKDDCEGYSRIYAAKIHEQMRILKLLQRSHPFNKSPLMTDAEKLKQRQDDLNKEIKTLIGFAMNLEKQFSSLF